MLQQMMDSDMCLSCWIKHESPNMVLDGAVLPSHRPVAAYGTVKISGRNWPMH